MTTEAEKEAAMLVVEAQGRIEDTARKGYVPAYLWYEYDAARAAQKAVILRRLIAEMQPHAVTIAS